MKRKLFLEKMDDADLLKLLSLASDLEKVGYVESELFHTLANTWYSNPVEIERLFCLQIDIYKECALRYQIVMEQKGV